jgi:hypothetical protein
MPEDVIAAVITLPALQGRPDSETVDAVPFDLPWQAVGGTMLLGRRCFDPLNCQEPCSFSARSNRRCW